MSRPVVLSNSSSGDASPSELDPFLGRKNPSPRASLVGGVASASTQSSAPDSPGRAALRSRRFRTTLLVCLVVGLLFLTLLLLSDNGLQFRPSVRMPVGIPESRRYLYNPNTREFKVLLIADPDKRSATSEKRHQFQSFTKEGVLVRNPEGRYEIRWGEEKPVLSKMNEGLRGMELSELVFFNGQLLTGDDRTGIIFELKDNKVYPRHILADGDGNQSKGFKIEWATVKEESLYVGSQGKEFVDAATGEVVSEGNFFVKRIDENGKLVHENWKKRYNLLRESAGITYPGYMIHEAVCWNPHKEKWYFFPRRASKEAYDEDLDLDRATNLVLSVVEPFDSLADISVTNIGEVNPRRGVSSCKFLPNNPNHVLLVKSEEDEKENFKSYVTVLDVEHGSVLLDDVDAGDMKFEGVEFI